MFLTRFSSPLSHPLLPSLTLGLQCHESPRTTAAAYIEVTLPLFLVLFGPEDAGNVSRAQEIPFGLPRPGLHPDAHMALPVGRRLSR